MKNTVLLLTALTLFCTSGLAQKPEAEWIRTITNDGTSLISLIDSWVDPQGNVYYLGDHYGDISIEQGPTIQNPDHEERTFLVKYLSDGSFAWVIPFGANAFFNGHLSGDVDGNVLLAGTFNRGFIDFGNAVVIERSCSNCQELFIVAFSPNGLAQWAQTIEADNNSVFHLSGLDTNIDEGYLYISGSYTGQQMTFHDGDSYTIPDNTAFFLARLKETAKPDWVRFLEPGSGPAKNLLQTLGSDGTCFVLGAYGADVQFTASAQLPYYNDFQSNYVAAYSKQGEFLWAKNLHSESFIGVNDLKADEQGGVYFASYAFEPVFSGNDNVIPAGPGELGGFLLRVSEDNTSVPLITRHGFWANAVSSLAVASNGTFYTGGYFYDTSFTTVNGVDLPNSGDSDILLCKGQGDALSDVFSLGGPFFEDISNSSNGNAMGLDAKGNLFISGNFGGAMTLPPLNVFGLGVYIAKLKTGTSPVSEAVSPEDFTISPNPANGIFQVRLDTDKPDGSLIIFDLDGRERYRAAVSGKVQTIDAGLPAGMYCLQWQGADGRSVMRKVCVVR